MDEFLIGNIGSEKILTSLSTTTYPLQFINQFQQENGISKKSLPTVAPVLNLLDLHQIPRGDLYLNLLISLKKDLLLKINSLNKQELEKLLEQTFPYIGFEELQEIPMNVMKRLTPEVPVAFLLKLAEQEELYEQCPIEVKRQIWIVNEELFKEKIQPLIYQYIEDPILIQDMNDQLLSSGIMDSSSTSSISSSSSSSTSISSSSSANIISSSTSSTSLLFGGSHLPTPAKRRENNIILQEIVELFGKLPELYQMFINHLKRVYGETGNYLCCNLRAEILMAVHDHSISEIYDTDASHNVAWCLDACIRDNTLDARRIKEIQTNLSSSVHQNSTILGDTAMVFANPIAVNCIIRNILIQLREVVKRKQIPKDDESIKFLTYLLVLALKSHEMIKESKFKVPHVKKHILQTFYPILASQILEDITRDIQQSLSNSTMNAGGSGGSGGGAGSGSNSSSGISNTPNLSSSTATTPISNLSSSISGTTSNNPSNNTNTTNNNTNNTTTTTTNTTNNPSNTTTTTNTTNTNNTTNNNSTTNIINKSSNNLLSASSSSSPVLDSTLISLSEFQDLENCFLKYEVCKKITLSYIVNRIYEKDYLCVDRYLKFIYKMICQDNNINELSSSSSSSSTTNITPPPPPVASAQSPTSTETTTTNSDSTTTTTTTPTTTTTTNTTTTTSSTTPTTETDFEQLSNVDIYKYFGNDFIQSLVSQTLQIKEQRFHSVIIDSFLLRFRFLPFVQKQLIRYLLENNSRMSQRDFVHFIQKLYNSILLNYKKQQQTAAASGELNNNNNNNNNINKKLLDDIVHSTRLLIDKTNQRYNEKMVPSLFEFYKSNQKQFSSPTITNQQQQQQAQQYQQQQALQQQLSQPIDKMVSPTLSSSELGTPSSYHGANLTPTSNTIVTTPTSSSNNITSAPTSTEAPMETDQSGWD